MQQEILSNLGNPAQLERLYRSDKSTFKQSFNELFPGVKNNAVADCWKERLNYEGDIMHWGTKKELLIVLLLTIIAGFIAKLPQFLSIDEDFFYPRNIGFIVLPALTAYFAWKNALSPVKIASIAGLTLASLIFINALPDAKESDTLVLSCIHLGLFLWAILGFAFTGTLGNNESKRLGYLKFNGDLVVITTLIIISGAILSAITVGLFNLIGYDIAEFYGENIVVFALPAAPILGTFLTQTNPQLVGKVSPVIARIFSPLVLIMLVIYLAAMAYSGKDPYNDREFLLIFNALLIGVMAIIFFSVAETSNATKSRVEIWILFLLSAVTLIVNGIALSAIVFRISEMGITPNRAAVLGSNVLILINLVLVMAQLFKVVSKKGNLSGVGKIIALYLPVYFIWTIIVTFLFPILFGFK